MWRSQELAASGGERIEERPARDERDAWLLFLQAGLEGVAEVGGVEDAVDVEEHVVVGQVVAKLGAEPRDGLRD